MRQDKWGEDEGWPTFWKREIVNDETETKVNGKKNTEKN